MRPARSCRAIVAWPKPGSLSMPERGRERRWRGTIGDDGTSKVLPVLLLDAGHVDGADLEIRRPGINRRNVLQRVDLIDLLPEPFIETAERSIIADLHIDTTFVTFVGAAFRRRLEDADFREN